MNNEIIFLFSIYNRDFFIIKKQNSCIAYLAATFRVERRGIQNQLKNFFSLCSRFPIAQYFTFCFQLIIANKAFSYILAYHNPIFCIHNGGCATAVCQAISPPRELPPNTTLSTPSWSSTANTNRTYAWIE